MAKRTRPHMTRRRKETLDLLLSGLSEKEVGAKLGISQNTVHSHVFHVYRYYRVASRSELLALFVTAGDQIQTKPASRQNRRPRTRSKRSVTSR